MKKPLTYFLLGLLTLRILLWYADNQFQNQLNRLETESEKVISQADSLKALRTMIVDDSIAIKDFKMEEKQLLTNALGKQFSARSRLNRQLKLLDNLELIADLGLVLLVSLVIVKTKRR